MDYSINDFLKKAVSKLEKGMGKYMPAGVANKIKGMKVTGRAVGKQAEEVKEVEPMRNKKIFLLTDGAVTNPDSVIQLARASADNARIHSFGVGYGCSKFLVKEVAKAGRGSYSFVDEKSENLKGKVISALRKATEPSLKNCSF